jgi:hypothetical protein
MTLLCRLVTIADQCYICRELDIFLAERGTRRAGRARLSRSWLVRPFSCLAPQHYSDPTSP